MPDKKDEIISALEARIAALEEKANPPTKEEFVPVSDAEWRDRMHQAQERRMAMATPPSAMQDLVNAEPRGFMRGVLRDNRAPTGPGGAIPSSQQVSNVRGGGSATPGWADPRPLSNPPGVAQADKIVDEFDRRDRAELAQRLGALVKR
jgi:hypothetical protein